MKARILITAWLIALSFAIGYSTAWDKQEIRRLECGKGWYQSLELVAELLPYYEETQ